MSKGTNNLENKPLKRRETPDSTQRRDLLDVTRVWCSRLLSGLFFSNSKSS